MIWTFLPFPPTRLRPPLVKVCTTFLATFFMISGIALPLPADVAPREALPSREAIGWLLETEATGSVAPWINSRSGYSGTIAITQSWQQPDGTSCRTYTVTAVSGGPRIMLKGTGCRTEAGTWNLTEDAPAVLTALRPSLPGEKPALPAGEAPEDLATAPPSAPPLVVDAPPDERPPVEAPPDDVPVGETPQDDPGPATAAAAVVAGGDDPGSASPAADPASSVVEQTPVAIAASLPSRSDE